MSLLNKNKEQVPSGKRGTNGGFESDRQIEDKTKSRK